MGLDITKVCGEKTASALSELYGEGSADVLEGLDINKLLQVPGLGRKKAVSILRKAYSERHGDGFEGLLGGSAEKAYEDILSLLGKYIVTEEAENILHCYFPVTERDTIEGRMDALEEALRRYSGIAASYGDIARLLKKVKGLREAPEKKYYDYVVITDSSDAEAKIKNPLCDALFASSPDDAEYAHNSYSFVVYAYGKDSDLSEHIEGYADKIVDADDFEIGNIVPDAVVDKFLVNKDTLTAINGILEIVGGAPGYLGEILSLLREYGEKEKLTDRKVTPEEFIDLVKIKERELNKSIVTSIGKSDIGMKADRLLELFSTLGASEDPTETLKRNLPPEFEEVYQDLLKRVLQELEEQTGIDAGDVFPETFSYPITVDTERLYELRNEMESSDFRSQYALKSKIAAFGNRFGDIQRELFRIYELDFMLGVGRFIAENRCSRPMICDGGTSFVGSRSLFVEGAVPISYKIGETRHDFASGDNVTVLTGANSGGKTTLLETVLSVQILSQMGFFVPADDVQTTIYESIRYLAKAKSQNAGAFETTIKSLVPLATEKGKRLLLIDELESITEPGSAARIIATLIDILKENKESCGIIVTHLGEEISGLTDVRVDGIEATGLDDDLNLIVKRQPEFGRIGKSTPELIVEKLYRMSKGDKKRVYGRMLERLKE